jgi:hypothetical protein
MDNGGKTRMCDGGIATVLRILYRMKLRSLEMVARQIVTSTLNHYLAAEAFTFKQTAAFLVVLSRRIICNYWRSAGKIHATNNHVQYMSPM